MKNNVFINKEVVMRNSEFFSLGIYQGKIPWGDRQISVPIFYYDLMILAVFKACPHREGESHPAIKEDEPLSRDTVALYRHHSCL